MAKSDGLEMFEEFYAFIKEARSIEDVMSEFGGISMAVPAFVGAARDKKIYEEFLTLNDSYGAGRKYMILARKYDLGTRKIQEVVRAFKGEVGLFDNTEKE